MQQGLYILRDKQKTSTTRGCLSKAWYEDVVTHKLLLVKGNIKTEQGFCGFEPYSEVLASVVADCLGLPHIEYIIAPKVKFADVNTYNCAYVSVCEAMQVPKGVQKLSAIQFMEAYYRRPVVSNYWKQYCDIFKETPVQLLNMLVFDAIIGNADRHLNNWEVFVWRDAAGIHFEQAPLFDNGGSLLAWQEDKNLRMHYVVGFDKSKPFAQTHEAQIKMLKRRYSNYRFLLPAPIDVVWMRIDDRIEPILKLMPQKRAYAVKAYLQARFYYYLEKVGYYVNNEW